MSKKQAAIFHFLAYPELSGEVFTSVSKAYAEACEKSNAVAFMTDGDVSKYFDLTVKLLFKEARGKPEFLTDAMIKAACATAVERCKQLHRTQITGFGRD